MNYTTLQSTIADWLHRTDLTAQIPLFIELAEERINRNLRVRQMETVLAATTITDNLITPADDIVDVKLLWPSGFPNSEIKPQSLSTVLASDTLATATLYAWQGLDLRFNGSGDVEGVLYARVPSIADNDTTWLGDSYPSLYLYGALMQAAIFTRDDPATWQALFDQTVADINGNDQRRFGSLVARAR
jgi:hypothetical protein